MKLVPMWLRDMHGMHGETEVVLYSDHLAAVEQARRKEREACLSILRSVTPENPMTVNDCIEAIEARKA